MYIVCTYLHVFIYIYTSENDGTGKRGCVHYILYICRAPRYLNIYIVGVSARVYIIRLSSNKYREPGRGRGHR